MKSWMLLLVLGGCVVAAERAPMVADFEHSASYRWLNKKVLDHRILDDMEDLAHWFPFTEGPAAVVDARETLRPSETPRAVAEIALTREHSREGRQSLRLHMPTRLEGPGPVNGRGWGAAGVRRKFEGEDWRDFNRISLWVYPDWPAAYVVTAGLRIYNDGVEKLPALFAQEGENYLILRNHEWNHIVWEIGNVARDRVTAVEISHGLGGNEPEVANGLNFYFDRLELERVDPDYIEGWDVWPGRISYSHTGYPAGAAKSAIATGLAAKSFRLVDQQTGEAVLSKPVQTLTTHLGTFQVMDFSEIRRPGSYVLQAGEISTHPFRIDTNAWTPTIWKALNFFYSERCGMAIPGVHGIDHRDWTAVHDGKRVVINGGWHDAGDLTQGLTNTGDIVYGMFSLAERMKARGDQPELYERLLEEARWGLDWILKTSFDDGYRNTGSANTRRTNGIIGDFDDVTVQAHNEPVANFLAATAEAIGSRVLKDTDPRLSAYSLKMAVADWQFAVEKTAAAEAALMHPKELWRRTFDSSQVMHDLAATGGLASLELWQATGEQRYHDKAVEFARLITAAQQRERPDWKVPMLGFFYTSPEKNRILHYCHRGREQAPILVLTKLCELFPDDPDWMKWYSAVVLHSEYMKNLVKYTEPYEVLPASIYKDDDYLNVPESRRESFRKQVLNGIPLGSGYYLRLFPVWMDYRGHFGVILPQAQALLMEARLREDLKAQQIAERQLEWIIGRNPFSQSAMWGEGFDFPPLYTSSSGDMVGALPVGIQTRGDSDVPYWPVQNTWTYKEVWVHPVGRWIWAMQDLDGGALVKGEAQSMVEFEETAYGQRIKVEPGADGRFQARVPEGNYRISSQGEEETRALLAGGSYHVDLRPGQALEYEVSQRTTASGEVTIAVSAKGTGAHRFALRTDNLDVDGAEKEVSLRRGVAGQVEWRARIHDGKTPWVAVVVPDGKVSRHKDVTGAAWEH